MRQLARRRAPTLFGLLAASLAGCGPKTEEIGVAVLLAGPLVYLTTHLLLYALNRLWRRRYPTLRQPIKLWLVLPMLGLALLAPLIGPTRSLELAVMAYWVWGSSYLAMVLVIWRVWFIFNEELSFTHAQAPVALVGSLLALLCVLAPREAHAVALVTFIFPGYGGAIPGPLYVVLLVEAAIRGRAPARRGAA